MLLWLRLHPYFSFLTLIFRIQIFNTLQERLWRRTRSTNRVDPTACLGVDANRNFDIAFNTVGVSADPCSQTYPGSEPFSEPETAYIRDILHEHLDRIQLYMNIHSHGNWILYGYGFDESLPTNAAQVNNIKISQWKCSYGQVVQLGNVCQYLKLLAIVVYRYR